MFPPPLTTDRQNTQSTLCHLSLNSHLKGPSAGSILTLNFPVKPFGTRHECAQRPPLHPNPNLPLSRTLPFSSSIWNLGAIFLLPMRAKGSYSRPSLPL